jgi:RES domain-containing protein
VALAVSGLSVTGAWVRHARHKTDPLFLPPDPPDGRWQHGTTVRGLYLADEEHTANAEWYRYLAELGVPPSSAVPYDLHHWAVDVTVADLSSDAALEAVGLDPPEPSRKTWPPYQAVGDELWREGWGGVLAPSAARPGSLVLCLFGNTRPPAGATPMRIEEKHDVPVPPTGMTT